MARLVWIKVNFTSDPASLAECGTYRWGGVGAPARRSTNLEA